MKIKKIMMVFILLFFTSFVWAEKAVALSDLVNPKTITIEGNQIYITELDSIFLYSLNDFKLQKKFGGKGEGPGEFRVTPTRYITISLLPDSIVVDSIGKVTLFSREGKYLKEMKAPLYGGVIPLGEKYVGYSPVTEGNTGFVLISIYEPGQNNSLKKVKDFHKFGYPIFRGNSKMDPVKMFRPPLAFTYQDKIYVDDGMEGKIYVFDSSGKRLYTIELECDKIALAGKLKDEYIDTFKTSPTYKAFYEIARHRLEFSAYLPKIRQCHVIDNKIYALTYKRETAEKGEFLICDLKGTLLKRVMIPFKESDIIELYPYTIKDNKIYQLVESQDSEEWELHINEIN